LLLGAPLSRDGVEQCPGEEASMRRALFAVIGSLLLVVVSLSHASVSYAQ